MSNITANTIEATTNDAAPKTTIRLNGELGNIVSGGNGQDGDMMLFAAGVTGNDLHDASKANIHVDAKSSSVRFGGPNGSWGSLTVQGAAPFSVSQVEIGGKNGAQLKLTPIAAPSPSIHLDGEMGTIQMHPVIGAIDQALHGTSFKMFDSFGSARIQLDGQNGDLLLKGHVENDGSQTGSNLKLVDGKGNVQIHLDGHTGNISLSGDIFLTGADCAEDFAVNSEEHVEPGTVVVIAGDEAIAPSRIAYDKRVAGVVSGAGAYRPGLVLNRHAAGPQRTPVGLAGRAYCKVDADYAAVEVGDLLTTSATPGHAMKAVDPSRSFGCVIGKALQPLKEGKGLVAILIAMQ